ncbi:MAG: glycosyltransferase family 4 protein [Clostridiales bacterium]|nr:glycosyltransferase family 4 protein [Clostridiales bacterium]
MNILLVFQHFYPDNFRINDVAAALAEEGHTVRVLTGLPGYGSTCVPREYRWFRRRRESWNGVDIVRVPTLSRRHGVFFRALNYFSFVISGQLYARFCRFRADVVISCQTSPVLQSLPAVTHKKRTGAPLLLYCCDLWPESLKAWNIAEDSLLFRAMHRWSGRIYRQADLLAVSSEPFVSYLQQVNGVAKERLVYLPQHAEDFYASISGQYLDNGVFDCLFAGNVGAAQDVACLVRAAALLPPELPVHVHVVGEGSELDNCRRLAAELGAGGRISFHGFHPLEEMERFYRLADAFVLTLRGGDFIGSTLPAKLQGYMGAGKPLLAAADGAVPAVIREADCGLCVPAGDAQALAAAIRETAEHFDRCREKGQNGRRYYERHFTRGRFMERLNTLLRQLIE